jgi:hypothetical protein
MHMLYIVLSCTANLQMCAKTHNARVCTVTNDTRYVNTTHATDTAQRGTHDKPRTTAHDTRHTTHSTRHTTHDIHMQRPNRADNKNKNWGDARIELATSCTLSKNHTTRPITQAGVHCARIVIHFHIHCVMFKRQLSVEDETRIVSPSMGPGTEAALAQSGRGSIFTGCRPRLCVFE